MRTLETEIQSIEYEINLLKQQKQHLESLTPTEKLAIFLHNIYCKEHTSRDYCIFTVEIKNGIHDFNQYNHKCYFETAKQLIHEWKDQTNFNYEDDIVIEKIIRFLRLTKNV